MNAQDKYVKYDLAVALGVLLGKEHPEAVVRRCSVRKVFLEISQNSQESTCARASFNKVAFSILLLSSKKRCSSF